MYSTANVPVATTGGKYLSVGINEGVSVTDITAGESAKGTPYLEVTFAKGDDSNQAISFYMSDAAQERSLQKVRHLLVDGLGVPGATVDGISADTLDNYAKALKALVPAGNSFRLKFSGEQQVKNGQLKTYRVINLPPFAEATSVSPSKLKYNETDQYDLKKAVMPDGAQAGGNSSGDSLPF